MNEFETEVALVRANFAVGTKVRIKAVDTVPENLLGTIEFVDDAGVIFVKTLGHYPNLAFNKRDFGRRFILA